MSQWKIRSLAILACTLIFAAGAFAEHHEMPEMTPEQMAEMQVYIAAGTPGDAHRALAESAGTYDLVLKSWSDPVAPPMESVGTATRGMTLEGRVMVEEISSSVMGMPYTGHGMNGYDNVSGKYWSTWTDSMSTGLMVSQGDCDDDRNCTYTGSWNDPVKKGPVTARMTSRWTSPTTQVFEMFAPGKDGKEMKMMEIVYTKQ